jgi:hypothetical protein
MNKYKLLIAIFFLGILLSISSQDGPPKEGEHPRPPKESLEACAKKSSGSSCEFTGKNNEKVTGTCFQPNTSLPLACRPNGGMQPPAKK